MAAAIAKLAHPEAVLCPDHYNSGADPFPEALEYLDQVIIVDFSYPAERLNLWEQWGVKVTLIDHHEPRFPELKSFSGAILDADECGATLTWRHFFPDKPMPPILAHVRNRDIGANGYYKAPGNCLDSKQITAALSLSRETEKANEGDVIEYLQDWLKATDEELGPLRELGERLQKREQKRAMTLAATKAPATLPTGEDCWKVVVKASRDDRLVSQIGAAVCQEQGNPSVCWIVTTNGTNSLRSQGVDVAAIAKRLGGGGHPQSAGFPKDFTLSD